MGRCRQLPPDLALYRRGRRGRRRRYRRGARPRESAPLHIAVSRHRRLRRRQAARALGRRRAPSRSRRIARQDRAGADPHRPRARAAQICAACDLGAAARCATRPARRVPGGACPISCCAVAGRSLQPDRELPDKGRLDLRRPGGLPAHRVRGNGRGEGRRMAHWLLKSEPAKYSWDQMVKDKRTHWDGVRNFQAANNLRAMKKGDRAFFYHSNEGKDVVGIVEIVRTFYPDPGDPSGKFGMIDVAPVMPVKKPVSLAEMREVPELAKFSLLRQSRLSVCPVSDKEWAVICKMAGIPA